MSQRDDDDDDDDGGGGGGGDDDDDDDDDDDVDLDKEHLKATLIATYFKTFLHVVFWETEI